jgi:benzodiazapine receptor
MKMHNAKKIASLLLFIIVAQMAGLVGSYFFPVGSSHWYQQLQKPAWMPPGWAFAPIWIILYILMGISSYIIWHQRQHPLRNQAVFLYFFQLVLNALWTPVFVGMQSPGGSFIVVSVLLVAIIVMIFYFYKIQKWAAYLVIPYVLWVSIATVLNAVIWHLN